MQALDHPNTSAVDPRLAGRLGIYWLAFLLTGDRERSLDVTRETLPSPDERDLFFPSWMWAWSRRIAIAKALGLIRAELAASARRTVSQRVDKAALPPRSWTLDRSVTKLQLESALLAIDVFSRCALLLSLFEGAALGDVALLLDSEPGLVQKARAIGLRELTRNLAAMQASTSNANRSYVFRNEVQHV